jgi:RNA polymerase sigma factor (sigma-70 family)
MPSDSELLQRYVAAADDHAFTELVQRHLGLVYSAAWRRSGGHPQMAEDIAQRVFCDLARKARFLQHHPALSAWLHRSTRYRAIDALRAESRRKKLNEDFAMMEDSSPTGDAIDLARLRPLVDAALDDLKEGDREVVLLRYFNEFTFPEIAQRLQLSESAARMRAERALNKLRLKLERRGITSAGAALAAALANPLLGAPAPLELLGGAVTFSLAAPPLAGTHGLVTLICMSKITTPLVGAALAAGLTALVWTSVTPKVSAAQLADLREKHVQLETAAAAGADPALAKGVVAEHERLLGATTQAVQSTLASRRSTALAPTASRSATPAGTDAKSHRNRGMATPKDAWMTLAWAADAADVETLAKMIWMDPPARQKAEEILAGMPAAVRAQFHTPEELYGFFFAADALISPPPGADVLESFELVELSPGRYAARRPGSPRNFHELQQTPEGWKDVLPLAGVTGMAHTLDNPTLAQLGQN